MIANNQNKFGIDNYKPIIDINKFFIYWENKFNKVGISAHKKISKMIPNLDVIGLKEHVFFGECNVSRKIFYGTEDIHGFKEVRNVMLIHEILENDLI